MRSITVDYKQKNIKSNILTVIKCFFSFEFVFVLFLFAGRYKGDPRFEWVPVDITAFFFVLSVAVGYFILFRTNFKIPKQAFSVFLFGLFFVVYVVASLIWTPGSQYAMQKTFYIATLTFWPLIACSIIISQDSKRINRFLLLLVLFSLWIVFESTISYFQSDQQGFVTALGGNYLGVGRVLGLAGLIILGYAFFVKKIMYQALLLLLFGYYLFLLLVSGGRGPLLATIISLIVPVVYVIFFSLRHGFLKRSYISALVMLTPLFTITTIYLINKGYQATTLSRLLILFSDNVGDSANARLMYYNYSLDFWMQAPIFGHGIGAFPILFGAGDVRLYPHNLFLEILVELGVIGFILFCSILLVSLKQLSFRDTFKYRDMNVIILLMLLTNTFCNAMVSGDIPDNRILFAAFGLLFFFSRPGRKATG